jgi:hypothetical protein
MTTEQFWNRVVKTDGGCWNWTGASGNTMGHGHLRHAKSTNAPNPEGRQGHIYAHRLSWLLSGRSIPINLLVLHSCDNPKCVNPEHLFLGTNQDNCDDKFSKGRQACVAGIKNPNVKLTPEQIVQIKREYALIVGRKNQKTRLAQKFGITATHVRKIIVGTLWKHMKEEAA